MYTNLLIARQNHAITFSTDLFTYIYNNIGFHEIERSLNFPILSSGIAEIQACDRVHISNTSCSL